jgi:predicted nucleotidyltransferase
VGRRPLGEWIAEQDYFARLKHENFRRAAEAVAVAFSHLPEVRAVCLFGSVARPPQTRITRRGYEMLHDCKDVDLAVWLDHTDNLAGLQKVRARALARLLADHDIGVAHHQVDVFLIEPGSGRYLGRLCNFGTCPKGHLDCSVPGCGRTPLLKQHEDFVFYPDALAEGRVVRLYARPLTSANL